MWLNRKIEKALTNSARPQSRGSLACKCPLRKARTKGEASLGNKCFIGCLDPGSSLVPLPVKLFEDAQSVMFQYHLLSRFFPAPCKTIRRTEPGLQLA